MMVVYFIRPAGTLKSFELTHEDKSSCYIPASEFNLRI